MEELDSALLSEAEGLGGDLRGKPGPRQVTVLAHEGWRAACDDLGADLPWTLRRANLLIKQVSLQGQTARRLRIGAAVLEITGECDPCARMDGQHDGLTAALAPGWRGGATCRVVSGGEIRPGDAVELIEPA